MPPYVQAEPLSQIKFQFYDESDRDCASLVMSIEQNVGARLNQTTGSPVSSANILYRSTWGPFQFPDRTAHGMYRMKLVGHGGCNSRFRIGWGVY